MGSCKSFALLRRGVAAFVTAAMVLSSTPVPSLAEAELDPEPAVQEVAEVATEEQQAEAAVEESAVTGEDVAEPEAAAEDVAEPATVAEDGGMPAAEPTLDEQAVEVVLEEEALLPEASTPQFPDVPSNHWAASKIYEAVERHWMKGYANGNFGPEDKVTRGQIAVMFWNRWNRPKAGAGAKDFHDVKPGKYYYEAVRWASSRGLMNGYKNGNFGPDAFVTREQLAVICTNYVNLTYYWLFDTTSSSAKEYIANMSDADSVSSWALRSVAWCKRNGIIAGKENNTLLDPQGSATRAETAKILVRLDDRIFDLLS